MFMPSIQLGALKTFVEQKKLDNVEIQLHSAFAEIQIRLFENPEYKNWNPMWYAEWPYGLILMKEAKIKELANPSTNLNRLISKINKRLSDSGTPKLSKKIVELIKRETDRYVDTYFSASKLKDDLHVFGFSLNYFQDSSSIYMAQRILKNLKGKNVIFLFGAMGASIPVFIEKIKHFKLPAFGVLGEGEVKFLRIAEKCDSADNYADLLKELPEIKGVYSVANPPNLWVKDKSMYEGQLANISELPIPEFDEYFDTVNKLYRNQEKRDEFYSQVDIPVEGTRGCFAKCSFCGLNYLWQGFRKLPAKSVSARLQSLRSRWPVTDTFMFMDNVCDTWAEDYADSLIASNAGQKAFMELRVHHPEIFWTKLSLSGVHRIQLGIEALSTNLLKLISKGTTPAQNVLALKYLYELGIHSSSNLIIYYPFSRPEDVYETQKILEDIIHFPELNFSYFSLF